MTSRIELISTLVIGVVESVSPDEVQVLLELDAPQATALNSGTPTPFPRINGYVLIPNETGATVAYISRIAIERSPYPKRSGLKDFGLIDLPFPLRKMSISPVGTLTCVRDRTSATIRYELSRGVNAFPSVGDQVLIPTPEQIEAIVGARDADKRIHIGTSPMASNAAIMVDPDKLFGRHLAVLGNTGSGKSCSVAGMIRWSIEAAEQAIDDPSKTPNMRFIVLDPNGEYAKAFADMPDRVRIFRPGDQTNPLELPAWMWNSHEWSAVTNAQPGAQRPLLMQALRNLRAGRIIRESIEVKVVRQLRMFQSKLHGYLADGTGQSYTGFPGSKNAALTIKNITEVFHELQSKVGAPEEKSALLAIETASARVYAKRASAPRNGTVYYDDFNIFDFENLNTVLTAAIDVFPTVPIEDVASEDSPIPFDIELLADALDDLSADNPANVANFISFLTLRIRGLVADKRLSTVINPEKQVVFEDWLEDYVGKDAASNGLVAILDLSLVPSEVIHIVIATMARLTFEALQRYRKHDPNGEALPTVLVLEEAHTFVRHNRDENYDNVSPSRLCREAFERIAREGRKFGLGLVLASQRPSELSPTVLAQCNTFLLHRIVNDSDQNLVRRLVPDNVGALLGELPSLPSRQAILLGWATPIPVLVEVEELAVGQRPQSADPDFWDVWTLRKPRPIDWNLIASEWSGDDSK